MYKKNHIIREIEQHAVTLGSYEKCMIGVVSDPEVEEKSFVPKGLSSWQAESSNLAKEIQTHFIENGMFPHCRNADADGKWVIVY